MRDLPVSGVPLSGGSLLALSSIRRRKGRCDENRPDCGHCRRLQLDCSWQEDLGPRLGVRTKKVRHRLQQKPQQQLQTELSSQLEITSENTEPTVPTASNETLQAPDALSNDDPSFNLGRFGPHLFPGAATLV